MSPGEADGAAPAIDRVRRERRWAEEGQPPEGPHELFVNAEWEDRFPGLAVGITAASPGSDFGLTTAPSAWALSERMEALSRQLGFPTAAIARQVHGREVVHLRDEPPPGLLLSGAADGFVTRREGILLAVTAADCVPVYLLDPSTGALGLLHAGWRGTAAGVLASGVEALERRLGAAREDVLLHLGPAICGECYEVGPEVLEALGGGGVASTGGSGEQVLRVDLRRELARRARELGIAPEATSRSAWCTRCDADQFHSHRGKGSAAGRMAAFLGWRPDSAGDRAM